MRCKLGIRICKETLKKKERVQRRATIIPTCFEKLLNLRKNVDISKLALNVRGNSLSMQRESFSSRVRNSFCSWASIRDNFFVNRIVQTWNSIPNNIVTSPSLYYFKSSIDEHFKIFGCYVLLNTQQYR